MIKVKEECHYEQYVAFVTPVAVLTAVSLLEELQVSFNEAL